MTTTAFLGIDCGTQSTKAVLVAAEGEQILAVGRADHDIIERDDGTREQHPDWWVDALVDSVRSALGSAGAVEIVGIGVSGQQHGMVCLDGADRPVRPAKLWNDTTTQPQCDKLTSALGGPEAVLELTGNAFLPGYTAPKVQWLKDHELESYKKTSHICLPHDFLNLWLTGTYGTEPGDASGTAYFDVSTRSYSAAVLAALDGDRDWDDALPPIVDSLSVIGILRDSAAEKLALTPGIPVSGGGGDNMCSAIGVGAVKPGPVVVSLGTSGTGFAFSSTPAVDPLGEAAAFCDSTGAWLPLVCTLNAAGATEWGRNLFTLDRAGVEGALSDTEPGAGGLVFLPHLGGERTPNHPSGAGAFAGLRTGHGPNHFMRAVVEGVTFGLRYALKALERSGIAPAEVTLVGGGAASESWGQICADIFELPVARPEVDEAAAMGAALQARAAVGQQRVTDWAPRIARRWEPVDHPSLKESAAAVDELRAAALERGF
jgi:D-xylulose kinase